MIISTLTCFPQWKFKNIWDLFFVYFVSPIQLCNRFNFFCRVKLVTRKYLLHFFQLKNLFLNLSFFSLWVGAHASHSCYIKDYYYIDMYSQYRIHGTCIANYIRLSKKNTEEQIFYFSAYNFQIALQRETQNFRSTFLPADNRPERAIQTKWNIKINCMAR